VTNTTFHDASLTVYAVATEVAYENALDEFQVLWGTYVPPSNGTVTSNDVPVNNITSSSGTPTSNNTISRSCGVPPSAIISGFPAAACGPDFDSIIDAAIGYLNLSDPSALAEFAPGFSESEDASLDARSMKLQRRWSFGGFFRGIAKGIVSLGKSVVSLAKTVVTTGIAIVKTGVKLAVATLTGTPLDLSTSDTWPFRLGPDLADSPFGPATLLYSGSKTSKSGNEKADVSFYCVNCGVSGKIVVSGAMSVRTIPPALLKAEVGVGGDLTARLVLGLDAVASMNTKFQKDIVTVTIGGFALGDIVKVGPMARLKADVNFKVSAVGQLQFGAVLTMPDFQAKLDFLSIGSSSQTGFQPVLTPVFEASGEIDAGVNLGPKIEFGVGIVCSILSLDQMISIGDKPGIEATAKFQGGTEAPPEGISCWNGVAYAVNFVNDLVATLGPLEKSLWTYKAPITSGCLQIGGTVAVSAAGSAIASADPSAAPSAAASAASDIAAPSATATDGTPVDAPASVNGDPTIPATEEPTAPATEETTVPVADAVSASDAIPTADAVLPTDAAPTADAVLPTDAATAPEERRAKRDAAASQSTDATTDAAIASSTAEASASATISAADAAATNSDDDAADTPDTDDSDIDTDLAAEAEADAAGFDTDDPVEVTILDSTGTYLLALADNGNFVLDPASNPTSNDVFASINQTVSSDFEEDLMWYYPDEMAAFNVSRFRMGSQYVIPKTSDVISLVPLDYEDGTPPIYVAVDTKDNVFYTMVCSYADDTPAQIFLAADPEAGATKLADPGLMYILTGGVVSECSYFAFVATTSGLDG
jgi:hypothetical protein